MISGFNTGGNFTILLEKEMWKTVRKIVTWFKIKKKYEDKVLSKKIIPRSYYDFVYLKSERV